MGRLGEIRDFRDQIVRGKSSNQLAVGGWSRRLKRAINTGIGTVSRELQTSASMKGGEWGSDINEERGNVNTAGGNIVSHGG